MAHIDNEFNKRFRNQQLPNDDFDTEGLWDAISEDMDSGQAPPDTHISITKWLSGLVVLLVIGGMLGVFYLKSDDNINHIITQKTDHNIDNSITNTHQNNEVVPPINPKNNVVAAPSNPKENDSKNIQTNTKSINAKNTVYKSLSHS